MADIIIVETKIDSQDGAHTIARALVERRLAAAAQVSADHLLKARRTSPPGHLHRGAHLGIAQTLGRRGTQEVSADVSAAIHSR